MKIRERGSVRVRARNFAATTGKIWLYKSTTLVKYSMTNEVMAFNSQKDGPIPGARNKYFRL